MGRSAPIWEWAGTESGEREPDVVLAAIRDVPTQEVPTAAQLEANGPAIEGRSACRPGPCSPSEGRCRGGTLKVQQESSIAFCASHPLERDEHHGNA